MRDSAIVSRPDGIPMMTRSRLFLSTCLSSALLAFGTAGTALADCGSAYPNRTPPSGATCVVGTSGAPDADILETVDPTNPVNTNTPGIVSQHGPVSLTILAGSGLVNTNYGVGRAGVVVETMSGSSGSFSNVSNAGTIIGGVDLEQNETATITNSGILRGPVGSTNTSPGAINYTGQSGAVSSGDLTVTNAGADAARKAEIKATATASDDSAVAAIHTLTNGTVTVHNDNGIISGQRGVQLDETSSGLSTTGSLV